MTTDIRTRRFGKAIEILLWLAALGVLVENVSLLRQNRSLQETWPRKSPRRGNYRCFPGSRWMAASFL